jgi:hypothetical protein
MSDEIITVDPELEEITVDEFGEILDSSHALTVRPVDAQALMMPSNTVANIIARRDMVQQLVDQLLVRGVHYGQIPGTQGESLWLPGAEAIAAQFGFQVDVTLQEKDVDRHSIPPYFEYRYKAVVRKGQHTIAMCEGSCNSQEDCFKTWVTCAPPDKDTQQEMMANKTGKWDSYGGTEQWKEKRDHPNPFSIINNVQKRGQKRAYVGAIEKATGVSGFFAKAVDQKKHFGGKGSSNTVNRTNGDIGPNEYWTKVRGSKISQTEAKGIADRVIANEITWEQATGLLSKTA